MTTPINRALPPPKQIRFVNNQGQPPSKRRRINAACLTCRKRKTRCAGEKPDCSTCKKNGHVCLGYTDLVERRRDDHAGEGFMIMRSEPTDLPNVHSANRNGHGNGNVNGNGNVVNGNRHDYLDDDDDDDDDDDRERRFWASKPVPPTAGFVDQDVMSRTDSRSSTVAATGRSHEHGNDWDQDTGSQGSGQTIRRPNAPRNTSSEESRSSKNQLLHRRVPYFRYFGATAIVPGFKQMVANVYRDRRKKSRASSFGTMSPGSLRGNGMHHNHAFQHESSSETHEDLPVYDVNSPEPVHPLIIHLAETFFLHLGCNYLFLRPERFLPMLKEKRIEPILVDAVCALAARFSDEAIFKNDDAGKTKPTEYGYVFAQRAKAAIVDTFPCPSVAAVQACLLVAYERFGADQDSALWMYLGIAIRMAVDLGLPKIEGVKYQGERDPWYTRYWSRKSIDGTDGTGDDKDSDEEALNQQERDAVEQEREAVEQERIDTFWAVFVLDRVISSGTGRPVTFREDDFELSLPPPAEDPAPGWPAPFPPFIEIIHLYGRASDVLNNIRNTNDFTEERLEKLRIMERDLTAIYQKQDSRLHFNVVNFQAYVNAGQGTTFILLHFWFHALVIILHQPTLLTPLHKMRPTELLKNAELPNSRELCMSSAKTIADILAFAELIDAKSLVGNPFTSQPIYIAACAFLMESGANASPPPSRETSPYPDVKGEPLKSPNGRHVSGHDARPVKHSLLASAANQNYQRCYKSLQQLQIYWGGVGYILSALDQKSKGFWDCEAFSNDEYDEAVRLARRGPLNRLPRFEYPSSPNVPPIAYSLTGTTNSPNSNLTLLFQGNFAGQPGGAAPAAASITSAPASAPPSVPVSAATPPGNMIYDPIRQSLPETPPAFPPAYLQPNVSAVRYQPYPPKGSRLSQSPAIGKSVLKFESPSPCDTEQNSPHSDPKQHMYGAASRSNHNPMHHHASFNHASQHHNTSYDPMAHDRSHSSTPTDPGMGQQHAPHDHNHGHGGPNNHGHGGPNNHGHGGPNNHGHGGPNNHDYDSGVDHRDHQNQLNAYEADFAQSGLVSGSYSYMGLNPINDMITFNQQEVNFDMLGLQTEMMPPWLEILPGDILGGLFEGGTVMGASHHM